MSRSGYSEDCGDDSHFNLYRGAVLAATAGKRGQALLKDLAAAMDAMPVKRLITEELVEDGDVCALGALGRARGLDMAKIDPYDIETVADVFDIADCLAREIVYMNDEHWEPETPEQRFARMRKWVDAQIVKSNE